MSNRRFVPIKNLIAVRKGRQPKNILSFKASDSHEPYILIENFNGKYTAYTNDATAVRVSESDVLVVWDGERAGLSSIGHRGYLGSTLSALTPKEKLDPQYLFYNLVFNQKNLRNMAEGTGVPHLSRASIDELTILELETDEQQKIAEILTSVDEVIENTQSQINKLEDLKKATMNELLTKGIGHTEFKETEIGRIPRSWQTKVLCELVQADSTITYGVVQPGINVRDGVLFIRGGDVFDGEINKHQLRMISQSVSQLYRRTILQGGELLMSLVGYPGEVAIVPKELRNANIARQVALIRLRNDVNAEFVMHYLGSVSGKSQLNLNTIGSAQQVINLSDLRNVVIPMPTDAEQKIIVSQLHSISAVIKQKKKLLDSKKVLKKSLMQDLLTGKVRVTVN